MDVYKHNLLVTKEFGLVSDSTTESIPFFKGNDFFQNICKAPNISSKDKISFGSKVKLTIKTTNTIHQNHCKCDILLAS